MIVFEKLDKIVWAHMRELQLTCNGKTLSIFDSMTKIQIRKEKTANATAHSLLVNWSLML